jgi:DNA-binding protein HU-beta
MFLQFNGLFSEGDPMADAKKEKKVHSKADIISLVANALEEVSKTTVAEVVDALLETVKKEVALNNKIILIGFGTFEQGERKARIGRNPQTGKEIKIPASKSARFRAGKGFKDVLNNKKK